MLSQLLLKHRTIPFVFVVHIHVTQCRPSIRQPDTSGSLDNLPDSYNRLDSLELEENLLARPRSGGPTKPGGGATAIELSSDFRGPFSYSYS